MIVRTNNRPETSQEFDVMLCWMSSKASQPRTKYTVCHTENSQKAMIKNVLYKVDINTYDRIKDQETFEMNEIGRVTIRTTKPLMIDSYGTNRTTGSIILIDDNTNETVAAGMIV